MLYACAQVVSFPNQRPQSLIWERDYCTVKSRVDQAVYSWQAILVVAKVYAIGKALHLAVYFIAMLTNSLLPGLVMLGWSCSCLNTVVSCMWKKIRKSAARREARRVVDPLSGSSWQILLHIFIYIHGTIIKLLILGLWLLINLKQYSLGLAVPEINTKKSIETSKYKKTLKM